MTSFSLLLNWIMCLVRESCSLEYLIFFSLQPNYKCTMHPVKSQFTVFFTDGQLLFLCNNYSVTPVDCLNTRNDENLLVELAKVFLEGFYRLYIGLAIFISTS